MVSKTLIAALARANQKHREELAKRDNTDDFKRRFSALYGRGAKHEANDESDMAEHDTTIWEDGDKQPERLPDVPIVPDDTQSRAKRTRSGRRATRKHTRRAKQ